MESGQVIKCDKCLKIFSKAWNLKIHEQACTAENKEYSLKCPDCQQTVASRKLLRQHIQETHKVIFNDENLHFSNFNDFKIWKEKLQKENLCFYSLRATATLKHGEVKRMYYHCHRSGYFKSRSTGLRKVKSQGTNRIDSTCTSSMVVTESVAGIDVDFCTTHFGHGSNLGRCYRAPVKRSTMADKIRCERTFDAEKDANEKDKTALIEKLMLAVELVKTNKYMYSKEKWLHLHRQVDSILDLLRGNERKLVDLTSENIEPAIEKIEKPVRFTSSKKQNRVPKPIREAIKIKKCVSSVSSEIPAISSPPSNDHLYSMT